MYFASLQDQVPELKDTNKNRSIFSSCMGNDEDDWYIFYQKLIYFLVLSLIIKSCNHYLFLVFK